ncbi:MAG: mechanosensitive ion channel family protein [Limnothrix sp. RL_2_0]|nr:mechanosensitive ion channel family protein [Limnothrix sp. RL_2_0]
MYQSVWLRWGGTVLAVVVVNFSGRSLKAQEDMMVVDTPAPQAVGVAEGELFFADILVRGQPVFQVGSAAGLSAAERSQIINRRIGGLLSQSQNPDTVTMKVDETRQVALLQVNNRVLMTVTQQDAADFDETVQSLAEEWTTSLNQSLTKPSLGLDVAQRLDATSRQLVRSFINQLPAILGASLIVAITWVVAKGVQRVALLWAEKTDGDRSTEILIGRLCYGGVWVVGSIVAFGVLGLDFAALLGTLGLTSVAIGFSLKDVLSNYISGVILLAARPFRIHDQVKIDAYEGTVVQIQLRATTIRTYDGRLVYIPNQEVFQSSITNNTASPIRRSDVVVGVDYDADLSHVKEVIASALGSIPELEVEPAPQILVEELGASTVNLKVRFWVNSRQQSFLQVTSTVTQLIKEQLQAAQIEMPTDIYTLMFQDTPIPVVLVNRNDQPMDTAP